jgi:DNA-binding GntR family transcriptional regulator
MPARGHVPTVAGVPVKIDKTSAEPTFRQLAAELRRIIAEHPAELKLDEESGKRMLPTIHELIRDTGLSQNTIRKAVDVLRAEGLVVTAPGRGVYVSER